VDVSHAWLRLVTTGRRTVWVERIMTGDMMSWWYDGLKRISQCRREMAASVKKVKE
jgi:hypothetical protein